MPDKLDGCCEHGDHAAPAGSIFCSRACRKCDAQYDPEDPTCVHTCGAEVELPVPDPCATQEVP